MWSLICLFSGIFAFIYIIYKYLFYFSVIVVSLSIIYIYIVKLPIFSRGIFSFVFAQLPQTLTFD